jgi:hypothetical protein
VDRIQYRTADSLLSYIDIPEAVTAWDLACDGAFLWVACDAPGYPLLKYDGSGSVVDQIPSSLVPSATGLTMDDQGYLWASDNLNGKIYKIDPEGTGTGGGATQGIRPPELSVSPVPSTGAVSVSLSGFDGPVELRFVDCSGRTVGTAAVAGDGLLWSAYGLPGGPLPAGVYTVVARSGGLEASGRIVLVR